jgi:hypothetical protein
MHKNKVTVTGSWSNLLTAIDSYDTSKDYNIQVLGTGNVMFCVSSTKPTTQSYTIAKQFDIVVIASGIVGCWVKSGDSNNSTLSVEEVA